MHRDKCDFIIDTNFWIEHGKKSIEEAMTPKKIHGLAKSAILFVGDGMGMSTITAARIFKGQLEGRAGEEGYLFFESFPHVALTKVCNLNQSCDEARFIDLFSSQNELAFCTLPRCT